jgi:hypothetical protein
MRLAYPGQKFQDWFTQQWVILWGKRIEPEDVPWLMGPFGKLGATADDFVNRLAEDEGLVIQRNAASRGLVYSINELKLPETECARLSQSVVDFYERTSHYKLNISVKWNPLFKNFGRLIQYLFSNRIKQLNIPTENLGRSVQVNSEIITLSDPKSDDVIYTIWYRTFKSSGSVLYSGVYTTCKLPSGRACIKAVFPLPNGNATVIMSPGVGPNGELRLDSSGEKFGDAGFYFLLKDSKGDVWAQYISSFRDQLVVSCHEGNLNAQQTLTLWHWRVLRFNYEIAEFFP